MLAIPSFAPMALEQTYRQFDDVISFNRTEKWVTGQVGLFLNSLKVLDLQSLDNCIKSRSRAGVNDVFKRALNQWESTLNQFQDDSYKPLNLTLSIDDVYESKNQQKLKLSIEASPYGYNIKPLTLLSERDRKIIVRCIAEIRAILLYCPNVSDLRLFDSFRLEVFEYFNEWLPCEVKAGGISAITQYVDENAASCEVLAYVDVDEMILGYIDYLQPLPEWASELDDGIGSSDPFTALAELKLLTGKSTRSDVIEFLDSTIQSISDFLKKFTDLKSWLDFQEACSELNGGIYTDNPSIGMGFMLSWGGEGGWWNIQREVFEGMMQAGEAPTFNGWADSQHARAVQLTAEQIYRGAALLVQMSYLTAEIEDSLPQSESVDNEVKEDEK